MRAAHWHALRAALQQRFLPLPLLLHSSTLLRPPCPCRPKTTPARAPQWYKEADLEEQFVRGSGAGGQSVARTANCVILRHVPSGILVRCHATRSRDLNRAAARRELQLRLDTLMRGRDSVRGKRAARAVKAKRKKGARSRAKYGARGAAPAVLGGGRVRRRRAAAGRFPFARPRALWQGLKKKRKRSPP